MSSNRLEMIVFFEVQIHVGLFSKTLGTVDVFRYVQNKRKVAFLKCSDDFYVILCGYVP